MNVFDVGSIISSMEKTSDKINYKSTVREKGMSSPPNVVFFPDSSKINCKRIDSQIDKHAFSSKYTVQICNCSYKNDFETMQTTKLDLRDKIVARCKVFLRL